LCCHFSFEIQEFIKIEKKKKLQINQQTKQYKLYDIDSEDKKPTPMSLPNQKPKTWKKDLIEI
jgi:hypothetical protein